jgi:hypothetical protein
LTAMPAESMRVSRMSAKRKVGRAGNGLAHLLPAGAAAAQQNGSQHRTTQS